MPRLGEMSSMTEAIADKMPVQAIRPEQDFRPRLTLAQRLARALEDETTLDRARLAADSERWDDDEGSSGG